METIWDMDAIKAAVAVRGGHWFDRGAMRFFGTRLSRQVYQGVGGVYFVTSEQPPSGPRCYNIRRFDPVTAEISTVGDFCVPSVKKSQAHRWARCLALGVT